MDKRKWQHSAVLVATTDVSQLEDDELDLDLYRPMGGRVPDGWEIELSRWGAWHIADFDRNGQGSMKIIWRRMIRRIHEPV
jgi:hypothetical protein